MKCINFHYIVLLMSISVFSNALSMTEEHICLAKQAECSRLTYLAMKKTVEAVVEGVVAKDVVLNRLPEDKRSLFIEMVATSRGSYEHLGETHFKHVTVCSPTLLRKAINWVACRFLIMPASDIQALLIKAAYEGNSAIVKYLIESAHISPNILGSLSTYSSLSPLMAATVAGNSAMIELLLSYGADINQTNAYGYTALMLAISTLDDRLMPKGHKELQHLLDTVAAFKGDKLSAIKKLLEYSIDLHCVACDGKTALLLAMEKLYPEIVMLLINKDKSIVSSDKSGALQVVTMLKEEHMDFHYEEVDVMQLINSIERMIQST